MMSVIIALCSIFAVGFSHKCPTVQYVEKMGTTVIRCGAEIEIEQCYWYLGSTSKTDPILKLENNVKGGTKISDVHYDITSNCEMRITEAQMEHEATYTFVAFFSDESFLKKDISVIITVTPETVCPRVQNCEICADCSLKSPANETVTLTCYVDEISPPVSLQWRHSGNVIVLNTSSQSKPSNSINGTWNSSATIEYSLECGKTALLYCFGKSGITNFSSTVQVKSEMCHDEFVVGNIPLKRSTSYFTITCILVVATAGTLMAVRTLKKQDYFFKELTCIYSNELIPKMENLNSRFECSIDNDNGETTESFTSEKLWNYISQSTDSRVLILGSPGYGKTFLFKTILKRWIEREILPGVVLIYFDLKKFNKTSCILAELEVMLQSNRVSVQDLKKLLKQRKSLLLLDGLTDFNPETSAVENTHRCGEMGTCLLTVNDLLQGTSNGFPKMKVWISSRPTDDELFKQPYRLITLQGFRGNQIEKYLENALGYYRQFDANDRNQHSPKCHNDESASLLSNNVFDAWTQVYETIKGSVSPLVAHLFALNFYKNETTGKAIIPNSVSRSEILWKKDKSAFRVLHTDWHLFACLYDSCTQDYSKQLLITTLFQGQDVVFEKGENGYRRDAVATLCLSCRVLGIVPKTITFCKEYPPSLNKCLPNIKDELISKSLRFGKDDVITFLKDCSRRVNTIRFINCILPTKFIDELGEMEYHKVVLEENDQTYFLDFKDKLWRKDGEIDEERF